jgi:hypothetical protein
VRPGRPGRPDALGRQPGDHARAAGDVEHMLAGLQGSGVEQAGGDGRGDGGREAALVVVLGGFAGDAAVGDGHGRTIGASAAWRARSSASHPPLQ